MKYIVTIFLLAFCAPAWAQEVTVSWTYPDAETRQQGFRVYTGPAPDALTTELVTLSDPAARQATFTLEAVETDVCLGVAAYNQLGESAISNRGPDGEFVCLGLPLAPGGVSISIRP